MSERGQKIFKIITWIVLILLVAFLAGRKIYTLTNPSVSETEWIDMLAEGFEIDDYSRIDNPGNDKATGEYIAITSMKAVGYKNIAFMEGNIEVDDEHLIELAINKGIVPKSKIDEQFSEEEAQETLQKLMEYYFDLDNYPEYFEIEYTCDVVDSSNWTVDSFDVDNNTAVVTTVGKNPEVGQIVLLKDERGIARPRYVKELTENENGQCELVLEKMEDPSELYQDISFSGKADFSYMLNTPIDGTDSDDADSVDEARIENKNILSSLNIFEPMVVYAAESKEYKSKVDVEIGGKLTAKEKNMSSLLASGQGYLKLTDEDKNSRKFEIKYDTNGKATLSVVNNDAKLEVEHSLEESKPGEFKKSTSASNSIEFKVKLKDLQVATSYNTKGSKSEKFMDVRVTSDIETDFTVSGKMEGKFPLGEIELPIASTGGLVSVNLRFYALVSAEGEVTLIYEMDDAYIGMNISEAGFSLPHGVASTNLDFTSKVKLKAGIAGEAAISVGDWFDIVEKDIIDPSIELYVVEITGEDLKNNEGYEDYPPCVQLSAVGPTVTFKVSEGEDSLVYMLLDLFNLKVQTSYDIIKAENAPYRKELHIETELDGSQNCIEGDKEYCTHVEKDLGDIDLTIDPVEAAKKKAQEEARKKAEEARKKAQEEFEKAIEDAIERWIEENCGGC